MNNPSGVPRLQGALSKCHYSISSIAAEDLLLVPINDSFHIPRMVSKPAEIELSPLILSCP